ncbi:MAG: hypothetical protein ABJC13_08525 [Acidobacteriota bacterium]
MKEGLVADTGGLLRALAAQFSAVRVGPHYKQALDLAGRLEQIAPARSRRRSEFVLTAILKALWEAEEQATAEAYARQPDRSETAFDPAAWEYRDPGKRMRQYEI